MKAKIFLSER